MQYYVVYNETGGILYRVPTTGTYKGAVVDVPADKDLVGLDLSGESPAGVFTETQSTTLESNREKISKVEERVLTIDEALAEGLETAITASAAVDRLEKKLEALKQMYEAWKKEG